MTKASVLITNANIFDGENEKRDRHERARRGQHDSEARKIRRGTGRGNRDRCRGQGPDARLIDAHWHMMFNFWSVSKMLSADFGYHSIAAALMAKETLLRGFTTVRERGPTAPR